MNDHHDRAFAETLSRLRRDLRAPVGHIIGYAQMMEEDHAGEVPDEFVRDLQAIKTSGERLVAMVEENLGSSKRSIGEVDLAETQFQLRLQLNHISGYSEMSKETAAEEGWTEIAGDLDQVA